MTLIDTHADDTTPTTTKRRPDGDRTPRTRQRQHERRCARHLKHGHEHTRSGRRRNTDND